MTNPTDNGWRSRVQALEPTEKRTGWGAFGSSPQAGGGGWGAFNSQETADKRAQEQVARANKEREVAAASLEATKEKRRYEEAINLGSQKAYPSLGSAKAEPRPKPKTTLNFKAVAEAAASAAEVEVEEEWSEFESAPAPPPKTVSNFLDNFDDDDEEEEDGEFNADIISVRRRGDKGIW